MDLLIKKQDLLYITSPRTHRLAGIFYKSLIVITLIGVEAQLAAIHIRSKRNKMPEMHRLGLSFLAMAVHPSILSC